MRFSIRMDLCHRFVSKVWILLGFTVSQYMSYSAKESVNYMKNNSRMKHIDTDQCELFGVSV